MTRLSPLLLLLLLSLAGCDEPYQKCVADRVAWRAYCLKNACPLKTFAECTDQALQIHPCETLYPRAPEGGGAK